MGRRERSYTGELISRWRRIQGMSQPALAMSANTSTRHVSFIETSRAVPSSEVLERLCEALDLPARERHFLHRSAGYGTPYAPLDLGPDAKRELMAALEQTLEELEPIPAMFHDREFDVIAWNGAMGTLLHWLAPGSPLLEGGAVDFLDLLFRDPGIRPHVRNWNEVGHAFVHRLYRDAVFDGPGGVLAAAAERLTATPGVPEEWRLPVLGNSSPLIRFQLEKDGRSIALDSLVMSLGNPIDTTFQEIRLRAFVPADEGAEHELRELCAARPARRWSRPDALNRRSAPARPSGDENETGGDATSHAGTLRVGGLLKHWRKRRGLSQAELATAAGTSARTVSFIETLRSAPSEIVLERLCDALEVWDRDRDLVFRSAGFIHSYARPDLSDADRARLDATLEKLLRRFEPCIAFLLERDSTILAGNRQGLRSMDLFAAGATSFRPGTMNMNEFAMSDEGLRPYLVNWEEACRQFFDRMYRELAIEDNDERVRAVYERMQALQDMPPAWREPPMHALDPLIRIRLRKDDFELNFDSWVVTIGTPSDSTYQNFSIRYCLPVDDSTRELLTKLGDGVASDDRAPVAVASAPPA